MPWRPKVPSPTWRSFLRNHLADIVAIDMFVVATATFHLLYALIVIVLSLDRRRVIHFAITPNPTSHRFDPSRMPRSRHHLQRAFERWGSGRLSLRRDHRGRTPTLSAICDAFYRAIFNTIMTPERIFRSARTARDLVPYNLLRPATSLPSRKSAVCTIAMSVEPLRRHVPACTRPTAVT
jgi:hypothetical protein